MQNGYKFNFQNENSLDSHSQLHLITSIPSKTNPYYNFIYNPKDNTNIAQINKNIKYKNCSSPKYKNRMKYKNKLITKHYSISPKNPSKKLSNNPIITEPSCKLEKFLPSKTSKKHKTLVIDLDETLVHSFFDVNPPRKAEISFEILLENKNTQIYTLIRPGAIEFIEKMSEFFEIVIFTASLSIYALPIINFLDKNKKCEFKLFREHCCKINNGFVKDLKRLSRDLNNLIILDNNPNCYFLNKENAFPIKSWIDDKNDKELYKIIPYLKFLSNENIEDIRPILTMVKKDNKINYYKFNKIMEKYQKRQLIVKDNINIIENKENKETNKIIKEENKINENDYKTKLNINNFGNRIRIPLMLEKNDNKNNNIINSIKIEENEEKKNWENNQNNKNDNICLDNNSIKLNFENKIKSSRENKLFISKEKDNKENYSDNINIKSNLFNQKNSNNQINSQKNSLINTSIKHSSRAIFIKSNNINSIKNNEALKTPCMIQKHNLKPIINPINFVSKFVDEPKNNNENKSEKNTLFNKYLGKNIFNDLSPFKIYDKKKSEYFHSSKNYDNFNNIYFDYHKTKGNHKGNTSYIPNEKNITKEKKNNDSDSSKINLNRSNSEKDSKLYNFKSIDYQTKNYLNITKYEHKDIFNNLKINRSLSTTRREPNSSKKYSKKEDLNYRCFSSHQSIFNYNTKQSNNISFKSSTKYQDYKNGKKNLNNEIKNILYLNKSNYINNKKNINGYEVIINYPKSSRINWKKSNIIMY